MNGLGLVQRAAVMGVQRRREVIKSIIPLSGLSLWLEADAIPGLNDGDPVATWPDLSGNGNDAVQSDSANRPVWKTGVLNGLPVVRFDGVDDRLLVPDLDMSARPYSVFIVDIPRYINPVGRSLAAYNNKQNWLVGTWGPNTPQIHGMFCDRWVSQYTDSNIVVDEPVLSCGICDIASSRFYRNAIDETINSTQVGNPDRLSVGMLESSPGVWQEPFHGDVVAILVYLRALSNTERQQVESYLNEKYAIW